MHPLSLAVCHGIEHPDVLPMAKQAGFDGFFSDPLFGNRVEILKTIADQAKKLGMHFDNSHATIPGSELLWADIPEGENALRNFFACIDHCASLDVPMLVVHCSPEYEPVFATGIKRMERLVEYAQKHHVTIAFENTSSEEYLVRTLEHFAGCSAVGFCYDSGHEAFCTPGSQFLPQLGDRLIYTHFNDNYLDGDHHLLPWDGKIDFDRIVGQLRDTGYQGVLAMEVSYLPYHRELTQSEFVKKCYDVSCRMAEALEK